jgi:hypothetical protein
MNCGLWNLLRAAGLLLLAVALYAQVPALTNVLDTLYNSNGTTASGTVVITWRPFTTADGATIDSGSLSYTITAGVINLNLAPNENATPTGTSYQARYALANGGNYTETWVVPAAGPVTIADIRSLTIPTPTVQVSVAQLPSGIKARSIHYTAGCDACTVLTDADDEQNLWRNNIGTLRMTEVKCWTDQGSSIINLQRDDGTPANILLSNLTCSTSGATGSIAIAERDLEVDDELDFVMVTAAASGAPQRVSVSITATLQ